MSITFNGLGLHLGNLARLSNAETRSISAENPSGGKGQGGRATEGTAPWPRGSWGRAGKSRPASICPGTASSNWPTSRGRVLSQQLWMTVKPEAWRQLILRCYWDHEDSRQSRCR